MKAVDPVILAAQVAYDGHHGVHREGGMPYIFHPAWVAGQLQALDLPAAAVEAAWMHDIPEDTSITLEDLRLMGFSDATLSAIDSVTLRKGEDYFDMVHRAAADMLGRYVKWFDNLHNSSEDSLRHLKPARRARAEAKYARARAILAPALPADLWSGVQL